MPGFLAMFKLYNQFTFQITVYHSVLKFAEKKHCDETKLKQPTLSLTTYGILAANLLSISACVNVRHLLSYRGTSRRRAWSLRRSSSLSAEQKQRYAAPFCNHIPRIVVFGFRCTGLHTKYSTLRHCYKSCTFSSTSAISE